MDNDGRESQHKIHKRCNGKNVEAVKSYTSGNKEEAPFLSSMVDHWPDW